MKFSWFKRCSKTEEDAPKRGSSVIPTNPTTSLVKLHDAPTYSLIQPGSLFIVSAPACYGQPKGGVEYGPEAILADGLFEKSILAIKRQGDNQDKSLYYWNQITKDDIEADFRRRSAHIVQHGDPNLGVVKKPRSVGLVTEVLHEATCKGAKRGKFVLTLGGDHSIALGSIAGLQKHYGDIGIIWVDAHSDIHTPSSTDSGNLHGCPVSFLLGISKTSPDVPGFGWLNEWKDTPIIRPNRIAYIGLRDVDEAERVFLQKYNITAFSMHEVIKYGIAKVTEMAVASIDPQGKVPIHLSFDIDALDPTVAPSTGTPVRGGLLEREGKYVCEFLAKTGRFVSMDLVEVNPKLGTEEDQKNTVLAGQNLVYSALGKTYL
jgi:arginase